MQNMPNTYGLHWVFMAFVVIIFLSVCGLNIFVYLAKGTQNVTDFIDEFLDKVHSDVGYPAFDILKFLFGAFVFGFNSALGTEAAVQVATKTVGTAAALASDPDDSSGNAPPPKKDDSSKQQGKQGQQSQNSNSKQQQSQQPHQQQTPQSQSLGYSQPPLTPMDYETAEEMQILDQQVPYQDEDYAASSDGILQTAKNRNKGGWCFVGEDRGYRSCLLVQENTGCMSGQVFPSEDVCVNPELRR